MQDVEDDAFPPGKTIANVGNVIEVVHGRARALWYEGYAPSVTFAGTIQGTLMLKALGLITRGALALPIRAQQLEAKSSPATGLRTPALRDPRSQWSAGGCSGCRLADRQDETQRYRLRS